MGALRKLKKLKKWLGLRKARPHPDYERLPIPGTSKRVNRTWFRGNNTNFHPAKAALSELNAVETYVGKGWLPASPIIGRDKYITAFGSCFAAEVTEFLYKEGYQVFGRDLKLNAHIVRSGDGIVNSAALLQQFEWAFNNWEPANEIWHDSDGVAGAATEEIKATTRQIFRSTDVFIFTLGLSEVWYEKDSGDIFWRGVPQSKFDHKKHGFRLLSAEENRENLRSVYKIVRANRPDAEIIFTLSPIPLAATFRPISCITANSVSKASLRVAIDEVMREYFDDTKLHYFPSYEMVTAFFLDPTGDDFRHPRREVVHTIMQTFKKAFLH